MKGTENQTPGGQIKAAREAAGMPMRGLARAAGVSIGYLSKVESGEKTNPSTEFLQKIADALSLSLNGLLGFTGADSETALPEPRVYFRRKFGVSADEADMLAKLVEKYQEERREEDNGKNDKEADG